jgi:hypothetical protein
MYLRTPEPTVRLTSFALDSVTEGPLEVTFRRFDETWFAGRVWVNIETAEQCRVFGPGDVIRVAFKGVQ